MKYKIITHDGYILGVCKGLGDDGEEIAEKISKLIRNVPTAQDGYYYKLRADTLEWELVELPEPEPIDEEATTEDYEAALAELGVK